jgi:hypothetical protein
MANEMGEHYDFSELPTVVIEKGIPIVYDGNRRIAVIKYIQNEKIFSSCGISLNIKKPELKKLNEIPCNICDKDTALTNIERKHVNSGTWGPLERDYFLSKHRKQKPSLFVQFEEQTGGAISKNKKMNQGFVKKEVLTERNLRSVGIHFDSKKGLITNYKPDEVKDIIQKIVTVVNDNKIATRGDNRGKLKETLITEFPEVLKKLLPFDSKKMVDVLNIENAQTVRKTPRSKEDTVLFGGPLSLPRGETNNIYRDILDLYDYYSKNKENLSTTFPSIIRMALRLLVESAASPVKINDYIKKNFTDAKKDLSKDQKTILSSQNITEKKLIELLQSGAHSYTSSSNISQTVAMTIILGQIFRKTHIKKK